MNFLKKVWDKIKEPKGIYLMLFYIFFVAITIATLLLVILYPTQTILHYICYGVSAITFTYFVYTIVIFAPRIRKKIINLLKKFKFTNELLENYGYRTLIFSICSFILNIAYVVFIGILAIMTRSAWYYSIAAYYLILSLMKGNIFMSKKQHDSKIEQAKVYRYCGIMFIFLTIIFSGVIVLIYKTNMYFEYAGLLIYVVATYTFYRLTSSIINIFKVRSQDDLYIKSIQNINLAVSLISIIVLQVAMFQAFAPEYNQSIANALTGAGMSVIILILGIIMINKANRILKNEEQNLTETNDGKQQWFWI